MKKEYKNILNKFVTVTTEDKLLHDMIYVLLFYNHEKQNYDSK